LRIEQRMKNLMRTAWRLTATIALGAAVACGGMPPAADAATRHRSAKAGAARSHAMGGATRHAGGSRRPIFRGSRAAAQEAARLGAAVKGCNGKADMQRNEHQWVVLCSNGKTYVVETPPGAPAAECSLAGTGPEPACFSE
jgi:hypothetical protein